MSAVEWYYHISEENVEDGCYDCWEEEGLVAVSAHILYRRGVVTHFDDIEESGHSAQ